MDQYIARQPILNIHTRLYGYELLYRGAEPYTLKDVSGNRATASLLSTTFLTRGIDEISGMRPCFINFTQDLIERNLPAAFPKAQIVIEILEDVEPTEKVISVCRKLREEGYRIALDDFVYDRRFEPLLEVAEIVKIDVRLKLSGEPCTGCRGMTSNCWLKRLKPITISSRRINSASPISRDISSASRNGWRSGNYLR